MDIATSTNILCERADGSRIPIRESITACAAAGYRSLDFGFVELSLDSKRFHTDDWHGEIKEYTKLAQELGVRFVQAHATILDFCNPTYHYETQLQLFKRSILGAQLLEVPYIVAHPSTGVQNGKIAPDTHDRNILFFQEMAVFAKEHGVGIAIENMWGKTHEGVTRYSIEAEELVQLISDIGCENVGACWDVEHAGVEHLDNGKAIRLLGKHLKATHISDETGVNNIHILPYHGFINWAEVLQALADIDYNGPFAFEIQHYLPHMPMELIPAAMSFSVQVGNQMIAQLDKYKKERIRIQQVLLDKTIS